MQSWREQAACKDLDPSLFFPSENSTRQTKAAKAICRGCFCRVQCLEYAIETDSEGIWGGSTYDERVIISGILSSSGDLQHKPSDELEQETRKDRICTSRPQRRPAASIQPLVLNLPKPRESRSPVTLEKEVVLVAAGFSVRALKLRFA